MPLSDPRKGVSPASRWTCHAANRHTHTNVWKWNRQRHTNTPNRVAARANAQTHTPLPSIQGAVGGFSKDKVKGEEGDGDPSRKASTRRSKARKDAERF